MLWWERKLFCQAVFVVVVSKKQKQKLQVVCGLLGVFLLGWLGFLWRHWNNAQKNKALNRSQLTYMFNWYHMTPQFNITSTSVRGHPYVTNPGLLPTNVERVIFCLCRYYLVLSFPASKQAEGASVNWWGGKKKNSSQGRENIIQHYAGSNALKPG